MEEMILNVLKRALEVNEVDTLDCLAVFDV